ncbi:hypothetical protein ACMA110817_06355 [Achromobacter marplatensis]
MAGDRQVQHGATLLAGGVQGRALPGVGGGDQFDCRQAQGLQGVFRQGEMRDVDGVEAAAQETDAFQTQSRGVR